MKKSNKIAVILSTSLILVGLVLFLLILPYLYLYIGIVNEDKSIEDEIHWAKKAINCSLFNFQKKYTIDYIIGPLILLKDYSTALDYIHNLENLEELEEYHLYYASICCIHQGLYDEALEYAKRSKNKTLQLKIYIIMEDLENATKILDSLLAQKPIKPGLYLYKAEVEILRGNWENALKDIDIMLKYAPTHYEAWLAKARITKHLGLNKEYKKSISNIKLLEMKKYGK